MMVWIGVAIAGALGAACRYLVDHLVAVRRVGTIAWGTFAVNVSGSLLAGAAAALTATLPVPDDVSVIVAAGFLGAYTTFSTAMVETVRLAERGSHAAAMANLLLPFVSSLAAAAAGWWIVSAAMA